MRRFVLAIACIAMTVVMAEHLHAGVIITYYDDGDDLFFDYAGSLNFSTKTAPSESLTFWTVSMQPATGPVFYSANSKVGYGNDSTVSHTSGLFATDLPPFADVQGYSSGTAFMFRLNNGHTGNTTSLGLWGNWGDANNAINGQLVLPGQTVLGIGMVDGWSAQTQWGTITFRDAASVSTVPEPTSLAIFGIGALGLVASRRRRKDKVDLV